MICIDGEKGREAHREPPVRTGRQGVEGEMRGGGRTSSRSPGRGESSLTKKTTDDHSEVVGGCTIARMVRSDGGWKETEGRGWRRRKEQGGGMSFEGGPPGA